MDAIVDAKCQKSGQQQSGLAPAASVTLAGPAADAPRVHAG